MLQLIVVLPAADADRWFCMRCLGWLREPNDWEDDSTIETEKAKPGSSYGGNWDGRECSGGDASDSGKYPKKAGGCDTT